jgi:hypothetical protein
LLKKIKQMKKLIILSVLLANTIISSGNVLTDWMDLHCKLVRQVKGVPHVGYSRHFAYAAIAAYESIVAGESKYVSLAGQLSQLSGLPSAPGKKFSKELSLNACYASMLRKLYFSCTTCIPVIDSMELAINKRFAEKGNAIAETSKEYGKAVASAIFAWAEQDGSVTSKVYQVSTDESLWTPALGTQAAVPFWSENRSFTKDLLSLGVFKQPVFSADTSSGFYKMVNEVYVVSRNLTPEQRATALYWDDSPNGKYISAFGHWTSLLSGVIKDQKLSLIESAEAYAGMTISMHEACILAWKGKYQAHTVRPAFYIQKYISKDWTPLIATPPHPEFPAAHATLSGAAAEAISSLFKKEFTITDKTYTDIGMAERKFPSVKAAAQEAGISRLYGGIHYRYSIEQGLIIGQQAADYVSKMISFRK